MDKSIYMTENQDLIPEQKRKYGNKDILHTFTSN